MLNYPVSARVGAVSVWAGQRVAINVEEKLLAIRTTETTVTFKHPFSLTAFDGPQPAGTYKLVIDEDEIAGLSFLAYRRIATMLHTPPLSAHGREQIVEISAAELEAAVRADAIGDAAVPG